MNKMASIIKKKKMLFELVKTFLDNVKVVTFTTLLHRTLTEVNTTVMGVFFCKVYEQDSKGLLIFRVVKTDKGMFRTVSSCFLKEVEEHLKVNDLNKEYGWLFW